VVNGGWNIADCVSRSYDLEGMHVGTVAAGRIGLRVLQRLKPFDVKLHYYDKVCPTAVVRISRMMRRRAHSIDDAVSSMHMCGDSYSCAFVSAAPPA
jgi:lactate dehydrogenase-like 2-hydroxyacid dehydrogenase